LLVLVVLRNGHEDRLVKAATDEFDLATLNEIFQEFEIFGAMGFEPGEKRPGVVQPQLDAGVPFEALEKWEIGGLVSAFEDMLKISAGLMGVNKESEVEVLGHGDSFCLILMITRRENRGERVAGT